VVEVMAEVLSYEVYGGEVTEQLEKSPVILQERKSD